MQYFLTICHLLFSQRVATTSMAGLSTTYGLSLPNTITTTEVAKHSQKRHMITRSKIKHKSITNQINNKKNKSNKKVEIQPRSLPTWNQK
jgi:hypothetical protein